MSDGSHPPPSSRRDTRPGCGGRRAGPARRPRHLGRAAVVVGDVAPAPRLDARADARPRRGRRRPRPADPLVAPAAPLRRAPAAPGSAAVRRITALWCLPRLVAPPLFSRDGWSYAAQGELTRIGPYVWGPGILDGRIIEARTRAGCSRPRRTGRSAARRRVRGGCSRPLAAGDRAPRVAGRAARPGLGATPRRRVSRRCCEPDARARHRRRPQRPADGGLAAVALVARASTAGWPARSSAASRPGEDPRRHRLHRRRPALAARHRDAARPSTPAGAGRGRQRAVAAVRGLAGRRRPGLDRLARRAGLDQHSAVGHRLLSGLVPGIKTVGTIAALGVAAAVALRWPTGSPGGAVRATALVLSRHGPAQPGGARVVRAVVPADRRALGGCCPRRHGHAALMWLSAALGVSAPLDSSLEGLPVDIALTTILVVGTVASVTWAVRPSARASPPTSAGTRP